MRDRSPRTRARRRALHATVAALGLLLVAAAPAAAAPAVDEVALTGPTAAVPAGASVDVRLDLRAAADVYAYEATLAFDPALLAYDQVTDVPAGGFDDVTTAPGSVTVRHTRLGTSPSLTGDVTTTVRLTALAGGTATVRLADLTLVGSDAATDTRADVASLDVVVTPAPTPTPTPPAPTAPAPSPSDGGAAAPSPSATTPAGAAAGTGTGTGTGTGAGALSATGAQVAGVLVVALAALGLGAVLVRRRAVASR
ncbi:cohesin domain-containing protein [Cellulomonas sp. FA1]|uniref:cohesin domain-containing protein n=1 Tax=Cellulomonas sp. FA1 TaxID=1346710 RepID=UPI000626C6AB|nr:cohesin domain-containing protein [Cellulomonas sp. FA1]